MPYLRPIPDQDNPLKNHKGEAETFRLDIHFAIQASAKATDS